MAIYCPWPCFDGALSLKHPNSSIVPQDIKVVLLSRQNPLPNVSRLKVKVDKFDLTWRRSGGRIDRPDGCLGFALSTTSHVNLSTFAIQHLDELEAETSISTGDHEDLTLQIRDILLGEGGSSWEELTDISRVCETKKSGGIKGRWELRLLGQE